MATKNLARTAIEGGRCGYYKMEVAARAAEERAATRAFLKRAVRDVDDVEGVAAPRRRPVYVCFSDKLNPIRRFLYANCGRPWNKVRGELFARFDIRTTPGRHILFDHVLADIEGDRRWNPRLGVDRHGILRRLEYVPYARMVWFNETPAFMWRGKRRITRSGDRFMWWVPSKKIDATTTRWRAVGLLSDEEEKYLRSLPEKTIEKLLA